MEFSLRISLLSVIIAFALLIFYLLKKGRLGIKYTLLWLFAVLVMLFMTLFPNVVFSLAGLVGIKDGLNFIWVAQGLFSLIILLSLTVIVSGFKNHIIRLTQKVALLEKELMDTKAGLGGKPEDGGSEPEVAD